MSYLHCTSAAAATHGSRRPQKTPGPHVTLRGVRDGSALRGRLQHNAADVVDALSDGLRGPADGHRPLRRVGQHFGGHLWVKSSVEIPHICKHLYDKGGGGGKNLHNRVVQGKVPNFPKVGYHR